MAGSYQAKIDVIIGGLREVAALEGRLESLQATITAINKAPVDLNVGGRGRGRDLSGKLSKNVNDLVRNFDNFGKSFSSVNKQAVLFGDLVSQTALKSTGEFKKQDVAVKNLATAYTKATSEAARFEQQQVNLIRTSKGLQSSTEREIELLRRRAKVSRLREKRRRGQNLQQDLALGAGFPLLFGGGAGSVLGGVAGALAGRGAGGFGLQVLGSAIGQQVDAFVQATTEAGVALTSTGGALEFVREKALFSSAENEELAAKLEKQGDAAGLSALLTQELADKIGNQGVQALGDLGTETENVTTLWNELTLQLQALIAGPLSDFLSLIGDLLGEQVAFNRLSRLQQDLAGTEEGKRLDAAVASLKAPGTVELGDGRTIEDPFAFTNQFTGKAATDLFEQFKEFRPTPEKLIPVTLKDRRDFSGSGDKAAREAERVRQRIDALRREREEIIAISAIKDKIALAEAANDSQLVIRLQGQQRLRQIETERLNDLAKAKTVEEARAINQTAVVKALAAQLETGRQLTEDQRQRQELFETTIEGLEHQLKMAEATSQAERDRLKIAREMKKLKDKGFTDDQVAQAGRIMEQLAEAQQPLNAFIRKTTEDLNNLQQVAVNVSQGIGNAIGSSLTNGLQSLVTGAASVKEVFADMLKSVADILIQTAAKMIAQYIAIGIAKQFAGLGGNMGGQNYFDPKTGLGVAGPNFGLAEGGYVSGPTNALIGEGGEPEYVIPESKMRESMARYSRGARGSAVIPENGGDGTSGEGGGTAVAAPIDVRYTVERINSVDYVTADQFQRGMQQAAAQGATQGEQRALTTLRQNTSQRRRIGL